MAEAEVRERKWKGEIGMAEVGVGVRKWNGGSGGERVEVKRV